MADNINKALKLGAIGCGKMANAILGGLFKSGKIDKNNIYVYDKNPDSSKLISEKYGFKVCSSVDELLNETKVVLFATKPFVIDEVLNNVKNCFKNQLILSILAGVKIEKYEKYLSNAKIIRIMPNTPALIQEGISAICPNKNCTNEDKKTAELIMSSCGKTFFATEDKIDIITALSGSGPAYYYKIIELMAQSAQKLGLDYDLALLLSSQTALGSAKMVMENNYNIEQLIKNVTTPGGCTEVGNNVLNNSKIDKIFDKLIEDTTQKAIELG